MMDWIKKVINLIQMKIRYRRRLRKLKKKPPYIYD